MRGAVWALQHVRLPMAIFRCTVRDIASRSFNRTMRPDEPPRSDVRCIPSDYHIERIRRCKGQRPEKGWLKKIIVGVGGAEEKKGQNKEGQKKKKFSIKTNLCLCRGW